MCCFVCYGKDYIQLPISKKRRRIIFSSIHRNWTIHNDRTFSFLDCTFLYVFGYGGVGINLRKTKLFELCRVGFWREQMQSDNP